ncbi:MAG TPA: BON domain-containing protein [Longimicrobium sp.]|nr:BON domain-containing protein [Longimicrobium sp.]
MARYDDSYDGPYNARRGGWDDRFSRGWEWTPFPEQAPPSYSGGDWNRGQGGPRAQGGYGGGFNRYGGDFSRGYGAGFSGGNTYGGGPRFAAGSPRGGWNTGPYATPRRTPDGLVGGRGGMAGPRGEYGGAYEQYGGIPRGPRQGEYYGGRASQARGYDAGYAREPFMPDEAYRRHPEYRQQPQPREWEAHQHEFGEELTDEQVRASVYRRMRADAWLDPSRITVQVDDGVVTLTGEVDDFLKARYAWDDAWEAEGVRGVVNNLTVRADQSHAPNHGDVLPQSGGDRTSADEGGIP